MIIAFGTMNILVNECELLVNLNVCDYMNKNFLSKVTFQALLLYKKHVDMYVTLPVLNLTGSTPSANNFRNAWTDI